MYGWIRKVGLFLLIFLALAVPVGAMGFLLLPEEGRRGLLIAMGIAFGVQLLSTGALAAFGIESAAYLLVRVLMGMFRFCVIALVAFLVMGREDVSPGVTLLVLAGFLFVLLVAEPWMHRDRGKCLTNG